jgi:MSHA pilin protein MshD
MMASVSSVKLISQQAGATFVELIIAISILAIAIVPLTMTLAMSTSHSADTMIDVKVIELAQAYTEEILGKRFDENSPQGGTPACAASGIVCGSIGPEPGESRIRYDDVDDYHGLVDEPPVDALGNSRTGYDRFRVEVEVSYGSAAEIAAYGLDNSNDVKKILVRVTPPVGNPVEFDVYRGNF